MSAYDDGGSCETSSEIGSETASETADSGYSAEVFDNEASNEVLPVEADSELPEIDLDEASGYDDSVFEEGESIEASKGDETAEVEHEMIDCRNSELAGTTHPVTDVLFESRSVEMNGKIYDVVVPNFESKYDAQLGEELVKDTDSKQFKECNAQLKDAVENDAELRAQFDDEQLEAIKNGDTPPGYVWHHDAEVGKVQLVDFETHQKTGHTGGRVIWGGGQENR